MRFVSLHTVVVFVSLRRLFHFAAEVKFCSFRCGGLPHNAEVKLRNVCGSRKNALLGFRLLGLYIASIINLMKLTMALKLC